MKQFFGNIGGNIGMKRWLANSKGYSIPEVLVVMAVMGILGAIAVPDFSKWSLSRQVDGESKKLSLDLMLARISAIKNNNNVVVRFNNPAANQYTVHNDTNSDNVVDVGETFKTVPLNSRIQFGFFGAGINDPDGAPVVNPISLTGGVTTLTFNSRGQASASGSLYLIPVSEAGLSNQLLRGISVVQATGSVDYWEYIVATNTWQ
jgi:prepilin-type N-terminal cleavage/methylation domain-containing protein